MLSSDATRILNYFKNEKVGTHYKANCDRQRKNFKCIYEKQDGLKKYVMWSDGPINGTSSEF